MLRGFWKLTWVEIKIFVREPMGLVGTVVVPVVLFLVLGRWLSARGGGVAALDRAPFNIAVLAAVLIALSAVLSLVTIMAIYREGGILKRLRATPLSPVTILGAHIVVKLLFTAISLALLALAGRRFLAGTAPADWLGFTAALLLSTLSILSLGFVIASLVPTARFAQPVGAILLYPLLAISGLFFPIERLPAAAALVAQLSPLTYAVSLMEGMWEGAGWGAHLGDVAALLVIFGVAVAISSRVFRWE